MHVGLGQASFPGFHAQEYMSLHSLGSGRHPKKGLPYIHTSLLLL